ncbi:MAG: hypothetical protein WA484_16075 [Solirubrobacteraceae bacterium]
MASGEALIDQALAAMPAMPPVKLGEPIECTSDQALVLCVYEAAKARNRGWPGSDDAEVERYAQTARRAGIPEHEIEAAIAAASRERDD